MNKVILSGRITKDLELRTTKGGKSCLVNTIAVKREFKTNGQYETDFINFLTFDVAASFLNQYASKGTLIELCGRWQNRNYENQQGQKVYISEVVCESVSILESKKEQPKKQEVEANVFDDTDDLPF